MPLRKVRQPASFQPALRCCLHRSRASSPTQCGRERMSDSLQSGLTSSGGKDEVDRPLCAVKFKVSRHQRTVGVAARMPRQREGMEDKVGWQAGQHVY